VELLTRSWTSAEVVSRGRVHDAGRLPGLVCTEGEEHVGAATYDIRGDECELVTLDTLRAGRGVGSALLAAVADEATRAGCRRLWLITTNDNRGALAFYQRRGLSIVAVRRGAIEESRRLKPSIPLVGNDGIPIEDEIELELRLG
jgi:ribosomal protein S18 acetylase RimI-like enzyme